MLEFFVQNIGTLVVLLALAAVLGLILRKMAQDRKKGGCCGGCAGCPGVGQCASKPTPKPLP